jgi:glycosyltransferase involved in cell wall biosynthesis
MSQFALAADVPKRVIDQHNAVYLIPKRLAAREHNPVKRVVLEREWRVLARKEAEICRRFDQVIHVTGEDQAALGRITAREAAPSTVIPICVDAQATPLVHGGGMGNGLLHLGTMHWPPNVEGVLWFAREVFPRIRDRASGTRLTIVGKRPPRSVARLASNPAVDVTGYVADAAPYVRANRVFLVPLLSGGGMRVKILDAWMWGIPVVSTSIGAEGIDVHPDKDILIADGAQQFAEAVLRALTDESLCHLLSSGGREWVEERYDWRTAYRALDHVYEVL